MPAILDRWLDGQYSKPLEDQIKIGGDQYVDLIYGKSIEVDGKTITIEDGPFNVQVPEDVVERHYAPIHPGTQTTQEVHAGNGKGVPGRAENFGFASREERKRLQDKWSDELMDEYGRAGLKDLEAPHRFWISPRGDSNKDYLDEHSDFKDYFEDDTVFALGFVRGVTRMFHRKGKTLLLQFRGGTLTRATKDAIEDMVYYLREKNYGFMVDLLKTDPETGYAVYEYETTTGADNVLKLIDRSRIPSTIMKSIDEFMDSIAALFGIERQG